MLKTMKILKCSYTPFPKNAKKNTPMLELELHTVPPSPCLCGSFFSKKFRCEAKSLDCLYPMGSGPIIRYLGRFGLNN